MHPRYWHNVSEVAPPTGVYLLVCYSPTHIARPVNIARLESGHGWYADGQRQPAPLYWMLLPDLPIMLREGV